MNDLTFSRPQDQRADINRGSSDAGMEPARSWQPMLVRYLDIAKRRKWLLMGAIAVAIIAGLIVTLLMTPQYTATSTLEIKREGNRIVNVDGVEPESGPVDLEFYQTQWGLLRSQTLAERVATDLRLHEDPAFFEMFGSDERATALREGGIAAANNAQRQERIRAAAQILLENVNIAPERLSRLVEVKFTSPDPNFSARVANAWTRHFIEISLARRFDATSYARQFLEQRLEQLRQRLQESERLLVRYAANQRIINIPSATTSGAPNNVAVTERPLVAEDLSALNRDLNDAIAARVAAQSRLRISGGSTTEALANQAISDLRTRRATLAAEHRRMMAQFEPEVRRSLAIGPRAPLFDRRLQPRVLAMTGQSSHQTAPTRDESRHVARMSG